MYIFKKLTMVILLNTNYTIGQTVIGDIGINSTITTLQLLKVAFQIITPIIIIFISSINDNLVKEGYNNSYIGIFVMALIPIGNINVFKDLINTFNNLWIRKFFGGNVETRPLCIENKYGKPDLSLILMLECIKVITNTTNQNNNENEITIKHGCKPIICLCIDDDIEMQNSNENEKEDFILNNINVNMFIAWYRNSREDKITNHRATFHSLEQTSNIWNKMPESFIKNFDQITQYTTLQLIEKYIKGKFTFGVKKNRTVEEDVACLNYERNKIIIKNIDIDILKMLNKGDIHSTYEISFMKSYINILWIIILTFSLIFILTCALFLIIIKGQWVYLAMWFLIFLQVIAYITIRPSVISAKIPKIEKLEKSELQKKIFDSYNVKIKIKWLNLNTSEYDHVDNVHVEKINFKL
jgi:hypothetical protein